MTLQLTVTADTPQELSSILQSLNGHTVIVSAPVETKKTAEKKTPVKAPTEAANTDVPVVEEPAADQPVSTIKIETLREAVTKQAQNGKREEVKKLLTEFGAEGVTKLLPAQYDAFYKRVNEL